ncbi:MAG TPA: DUF2461 domain-containing protein [Acidimicrobiia bacterium]|nr:DUF2461 domain-containing protein [Acidimicrobiia bacterium]
MTFKGWPADALDFYAKLEADNSRPFWLANKATYDESVKAPFLQLSEKVEKEFGPLHVFRPNRDVRFSKDKSPYKTAAAAVTEGQGGASYYVQISSTGLYVGSGYYMLAPDQLERYRVAVADTRKGPQLASAVAALRKQRYRVEARESLKRVPRGVDPEHPRAELLKMKGMHVGCDFGAPRWLHTAKAYDRIVKAWRDAAPVNRWLDRHVGPTTTPPPEPD